MAKKNISTILKNGTPKQRINLLSEDIARAKFNKGRLLTDAEFNQLSESFKTDKEIRLYNKFKSIDAVVTNAIMNLQGLKYEVLMHYTNLRGYVFIWNSLEHSELLVNSVLHQIKDPKERKKIADNGAKNISHPFSKTLIDSEGYVDIAVDFLQDTYTDEKGNPLKSKSKPRKTREMSLLYLMETVKADSIKTGSKWLGWYEALLDYMDEQSFNIKIYKELLESMEGEVRSRLTGWSKYYGEINIGVEINPSLHKIIESYKVCPEPYDIEPDENEYSWFKREIIGDE